MTILDQFSLAGKTALVTGASRGLGQGMALALAEAGADVVAVASSAKNAGDTVSKIEAMGRRAWAVGCDQSSKEDIKRAVEEAVSGAGRIDILVNNAGTIRRAPAAETADEDWDHVIETNLNGVFRFCRAVGAKMIEQGGGKIVNIASLLSFQGGITVPAYAASKGGVAQLTKALSNEWAPKGIQVNAIAPGYFATDNTAALQADEDRNAAILARIPDGDWGQPDQLGGAVVYLSSKASDYVNGHVLVVDGGWMGR